MAKKKTLTSELLGTMTGLTKETTDDKIEQIPNETTNQKKTPGRPKVGTATQEVNVTFKLPVEVAQNLRVQAALNNTTQKELLLAALAKYLPNQQ